MPGSPVADYFATTLARHKTGPLAVSWKGLHSQALGFHELVELGDFSGCQVLDVGCGLGDLWPFLQARFHGVCYSGVDICEGMVAAARTHHPRVDFEVWDISARPLPQSYDWVVASGIFNLTELPYSEQLQRVRRSLKNMFLSTRSGVACTFLSQELYNSPVFRHETGLRFHYEQPERLLPDLFQLTPHVRIRHSVVDENIFTVYLYSGVDAIVRDIYEELPAGDDFDSLKRRFLALSRLERLAEVAPWLESLPAGPERTYLQALLYSHQGDLSRALELFMQLREAVPEATEDAATLMMVLGHNRAMIELLEPRLGSCNELIIERYVRVCLRERFYEKARECAEGLPLGGLRANLCGQVSEAEGNLSAAETSFREAWRHAPYCSTIPERLAGLLRQRGEPVEALVWLQRARELRPRSHNLQQAWRELLAELGVQA